MSDYLTHVYITNLNGKTILAINGEDKWSTALPEMFKLPAVQDAIYRLCADHNLDYISEDTVRNAANEGMRNYYQNKRAVEVEKDVELSPEITKEVTFEEIAEILSSTIKKDDPAKLITFSAFLLAQTETDQINIGFQSESSAGKSYIPTELSTYFPESEVLLIAGASPMAFFHDRGVWDDARKITVVNLENKIMIFLDQPHYLLLEKLRPLLSHDKKELTYKITDKSKSGANRTKNIVIRGFPAVAFATTKMNPDEQEKTRMILLSPSVDHDKLEESLKLLTLKKSDQGEYDKQVTQDPKRTFLINRIKAMRQMGIKEIIVPNSQESIFKRFIEGHKHLIARHQRDYPRIFSLIKSHALLNCFNRERRNNHAVIANFADIDAGFKLYGTIEESNEKGMSPFMDNIFKKVIEPLLNPDVGVTSKDIQKQYYAVFHKILSPDTWRKELYPQLEAVGLLAQEPDPEDKRKMLYFPAYGTKTIGETSGGTLYPTNTLVTVPTPPNQSPISFDKLFMNILKELGMSRHDEVSENLIVQELVKTEKFTIESGVQMLKDKRLAGVIYQPRAGYWRFA